MKKLATVFVILLMVSLALSIGCSEQNSTRKLVSSRPVAARQISGSAVAQQPSDSASEPDEKSTKAEEKSSAIKTVQKTRSQPPAGSADCEQLSAAAIGEILGGVWQETADCPQRPVMPRGVNVCQCSYDGPKQIYVNVETQLYEDAAEADRVFNMYCSEDEAEIGDKSCRELKSSATRPNFFYFLKGKYFVKVSCLGGSCPIEKVAELAKKVESQI
jgi:hypothetical protein